jgi:hypothetical protein
MAEGPPEEGRRMMRRPRLSDDVEEFDDLDEFCPPVDLSDDYDDEDSGVTVVGPEGPEE